MDIKDLPPFLRVEQAQELTQLGRTQIYEQTRLWFDSGGTEGIPSVRFGRCLRVLTAPLLSLAGLAGIGSEPGADDR